MKNLIERKAYLDELLSCRDNGMVKVITGMYCSGKSTLLGLFGKRLLESGVIPEQMQFYDFERPENYLSKSWETLYIEIKSKLQTNKPNYIFLDEIQHVADFEKLIDRLYTSENTDVYIIGSNANLLSKELDTLLNGRYTEISVLPFSFAEYLESRGIETNCNDLNYEALFYDYVNETSLPKGAALREEGFDKMDAYLEAVYATIVEKDIMSRHKITDKRAFDNVAEFAAAHIGKRISPTGIAAALTADHQSVHHTTVEKYMTCLVENFVFYRVNRLDINAQKQLTVQEKYYLADLGLLNVLLGRERTSNRGYMLENAVYLELLRRGCKVCTGVLRSGGIDFVAKKRNGEVEYYQVSWEISNPEAEKREFAPLKSLKDPFPKFLLTTAAFPQSKADIIHKNVFEWLVN